MLNGLGFKAASFTFVLLALVACDNAEERADKHFESGVELIAAGDVDRGLVELRNVLSLDEFHVAGRKLYAETLRNEGNVAESYQQFRRLVESNPEDYSSRLALAQMAMQAQNWQEVERHGAVLVEANVDLDGTDVVDLMLRFREAALADDTATVAQLTEEAQALLSVYPDDVTLRQVLVEGLVRTGDLRGAIEQLDAAIALEPDNQRYYMAKARALAELQEVNELEDFLREMVVAFPEDTQARLSLVRLLSSQGRTERAEEFLREIADSSGERTDVVTLITYIRQVNGNEAALSEIDNRLEAAPETDFLNALKSAIYYETNRQDEAIALMEGIVGGAEPSDQINRYNVSLAKMLLGQGNEVGARQIVEEILANDSSQAEALKMSAEWLIEDDRPEEAIGQLRIALDQDPDDAEAMTIMSQAHLRMGDNELAQDLLSLAVEASNNAAPESIRFARLLIREESFRSAETVLINALRNEPDNFTILTMLGSLYVETEEWGRADQVGDTLRGLETTEGITAADQLQFQILGRREGRDRAIAFLESMSESGETANMARLGLIRSQLAAGENEAAVAIAEELSAEFPDSPRVALVLGNTRLAARDYPTAAEVFEDFVDTYPNIEEGWIQLSRALNAQGLGSEANAAIDRGLTSMPDAPNLLWAKASFLERENNIDDAIEIYETLYEQNSQSAIIANNLASLLATYREDDASIERAFTVARRLRGTEVAPFQDTYGWILHRRGDFDEALTYLEPAAASLTDDPIVQYHLAMTYLELGRSEEAETAFERVLELAGDTDTRPQIARARTEIENLANPTAEN